MMAFELEHLGIVIGMLALVWPLYERVTDRPRSDRPRRFPVGALGNPS